MTSFDVATVTRLRPRRAWPGLALLAVAGLVAMWLGASLQVQLTGGETPHTRRGSGGLAFLALLPFLYLAPKVKERLGTSRMNGGRVSVDGATLRLEDETLPRASIENGFDVPARREVRLELADGSSVQIVLENDQDPERLLAALGISPDQRTLRMPLRRTLGAFTIGFITFVGAAVLATTFGATPLAPLGGWGLLCTVLVLPALAATFAVRRWGYPQVTVGLDGLRIDGLGRTTFIPGAEIVSTELMANEVDKSESAPFTSALRVERRSGEPLLLPIFGVDEAHVAALRLRLARMAQSNANGGSRIEGLLARGGRSPADWRRDLERLAAREAGFREAPITEADLEGVLENPGATPEVRIGAALALRASYPEKVTRIRVAAETTAADELRSTFLAIAEHEEEDAAITRALEHDEESET